MTTTSTLRIILVCWLAGAPSVLSASQSDPLWADLVTLNERLIELRSPQRIAGVPQLDPPAIERRRAELDEIRSRLGELDPQSWSRAGKIDYLLVWARANALEFEHRVTRPWRRDPLLYLAQVQRIPYAEIPPRPERAERWLESLRAVPEILAGAQSQLSEPLGELASLAIFHLESFDGVGQGQPYRDEPPGGTIAWYGDLCRRLAEWEPLHEATCRRARDAVVRYRDWLVEERAGMPPSAGIGADNLEWYFRNVRLLPYSAREMAILGEREYHRYHAAYLIVRNRNRELPELALTRSRAQHEERTRDAERQIRELIRKQRLLSFPPDLPDAFETDTFWSPRAATDRHFWEELQFRNTFNNHIHASIPGHRFDSLVANDTDNPIRRGYGDSSRAEGWATYLEEMFLLAGLTRDTPRADELFYVALMKRASRIYAETEMHSGELSLDEANRTMIDTVPFMEEDLGRYDLEGYLRRPGSGSGYIVGKIQLEKLLSERALELGDDFDLGAFHDSILRSGTIPLTLIRWEMTGRTDEVAPLWQAATGRPLGEENG